MPIHTVALPCPIPSPVEVERTVPISHKSGQASPLKAKNRELARATTMKASSMETRRSTAGRKDKAMDKKDSLSLSTGGAIDSVGIAIMKDGYSNTVNGDPTQKEKIVPKSPTKINPLLGMVKKGLSVL